MTPLVAFRRLGFSFAALALVALLIASSAVAHRHAVRVRVAPSNVKAGNSLFVTASVSPAGKSCTATIMRTGAPTTKLEAKRALRSGVVSWRWTVPKSAKSGTGTARVACTGGGAGSAPFRITALPPPAPPLPPPPPQLFIYSFSALSLSWTFNANPTVPTPWTVTWSGSFCGDNPFGSWKITSQSPEDSSFGSFVEDFGAHNPAGVLLVTQSYTDLHTGQTTSGQVSGFLTLAQDGSSMTASGQPSGAVSDLTGATVTVEKNPTTSCPSS